MDKERIQDLNELVGQILSASPEQMIELTETLHPVDLLEAILEYDGDKHPIIAALPDKIIGEIIEEAEDADKFTLLLLITQNRRKAILTHIASDELVDMLDLLTDEEAENILINLNKENLAEVKSLMQHAPDTAGGIMATEFLAIDEEMTVYETLQYLQRSGDRAESIDYLFVVGVDEVLKGVVSLKDIILSSFNITIADIMSEKVISVKPDLDQEEVGQIFQKYGFSAIPVVDDEGHIMGIITADDILNIVQEENTEDFEKMAALIHNEDEYLESSVFQLARKRFSWLLFLMVSATFTGYIIRGYEDALASIVLLAAFIPMLMDTGGNAGSQSATLIIRGIALGEIKIKDWMTVFFKEFRVSVTVGFLLGIVNFLRIILIDGVEEWLLAFTVSLSLMLTIIIAKIVGCSLPIFAKCLKLDPAIMAAPIITTIVDALSLVIYFQLATTLIKVH